MKLPTVFISYNPTSQVEQTLAIRLHTIGAVHGYNMLLPDRTFYSASVSSETKSRILLSDFFIVFSTGKMSAVVQEEISIAYSKLHDKSKILVVFDKSIGKNIQGSDNCTQVFIDAYDDPSTIVSDITREIKSVQSKSTGKDSFMSSLGGILLIGIGLFALNEIFTDGNERPPKRKKASKKVPPKKKRF